MKIGHVNDFVENNLNALDLAYANLTCKSAVRYSRAFPSFDPFKIFLRLELIMLAR